VHELATDAAKYGALSDSRGSVSLRMEGFGDAVRLVWKEEGGPPAHPPFSQGFRTTLLRRLDPRAELLLDPGGLCCSPSRRKG